MAKIYKFCLTFIALLFFLSIFLLVDYKKYQKKEENNSPLVIVLDELSINFLNGNKISNSGEEKKEYTFSITNNATEDISYSLFLEDKIPNSKILYDLVERNKKVNLLQTELEKEENDLITMVKIKAKETHFYTFTIYGSTDVTAKISVKIEEGKEYFSNTLLNNNEIKKEPLTKLVEEVASEEEGLIEANDDYGTYYYFRGNVLNNYVSFANKMWRIVKINSDGSVKLILDDSVDRTGNFYDSNKNLSTEERLNFSSNNMYESLNKWYQENLLDFENYLVSNKFCVNTHVVDTNEKESKYEESKILQEEYDTHYTCKENNYSSRIGLLSALEVAMAGASVNNTNSDYYLYMPNKLSSWWTLTPSYSDEVNTMYFSVDANGKIIEELGTYYRSLRPVINLTKRVAVKGSGTIKDPYTLK